MKNILILGGTTEARQLGSMLKANKLKATISFSGVIPNITEQSIPKICGGFGGAKGLAEYLSKKNITHLVDATHPFSTNISENAIIAAKSTGVHFVALERKQWSEELGDKWMKVKDFDGAKQIITGQFQRVFLAIGRKEIGHFSEYTQHFYLLRVIDSSPVNFGPPKSQIIIDKGPFTFENDKKLLLKYNITKIITKNSGGVGARAKIDAARDLQIPIVMIERPEIHSRKAIHDTELVFDWIVHKTDLGE